MATAPPTKYSLNELMNKSKGDVEKIATDLGLTPGAAVKNDIIEMILEQQRTAIPVITTPGVAMDPTVALEIEKLRSQTEKDKIQMEEKKIQMELEKGKMEIEKLKIQAQLEQDARQRQQVEADRKQDELERKLRQQAEEQRRDDENRREQNDRTLRDQMEMEKIKHHNEMEKLTLLRDNPQLADTMNTESTDPGDDNRRPRINDETRNIEQASRMLPPLTGENIASYFIILYLKDWLRYIIGKMRTFLKS